MTEVVSPMDTKLHDGGGNGGRLLSKYDVETFLQKNAEFTKQVVLQYLQKNADFTEDYFIANATMELFQKWYDQKINLRLNRSPQHHKVFKRMNSSPFNANMQDDSSIFHEDSRLHKSVEYNNSTLPNMANVFQYIDIASNRRRSEPGNNEVKKLMSSNSEEYLDTIDENTPVRSIRSNSVSSSAQGRYRTISLDENNNHIDLRDEVIALSSEQSNGKPSLRKAQSAPAYKKNLSHLIRSSVYSGSGHNNKHINIENHMGLKDSSETNVLIELIKDVSKDLSLTQASFKILTNIGFMLNVEKASMYIVRTVSGQRVLKLLLNEVIIPDGIRKDNFSCAVKCSSSAELPIGKGILGHVASLGCALVVNEVEQVSKKCYCSHVVTYVLQKKKCFVCWINVFVFFSSLLYFSIWFTVEGI